jgi:hypothetical protein
MSTFPTPNGEGSSGFRLDVPFHNLLTQPGSRTTVPPATKPVNLPEPVFPRNPELLVDDGEGPPMPRPKRHYKSEPIKRAMRGRAAPWLKSRVLPGDFHPTIAYLFTDDNRVKGMTEEIGKRSIGWLRDTGAGFNSLIVRTDGTLAPCFPMYNATYDWGTIENHKFESEQLNEMKKSCQPHCFSTLNHILAYCYNDAQALNRFQGTTNFD